MKAIKKLGLIGFLFISTFLFAQNETSNIGELKFESEIIDYGTIKQNADGNRKFIFKNVGTAPILISKVKASCGCTVATKPDHAILPNETAEIGVTYATNRIGSFSKSITVFSNAKEKNKVIKIKGNVLNPKSLASTK